MALAPLVGRPPATVLAIVVLVVLTGGLHQDGLADSCDALGVRGDRTRRLAVMRDSTVGTFGVLALIVWALLVLAALERLAPVAALRTLVAAEALGRLAMLWHAAGTPPARADGLGALMPAQRWPLVPATVIGVVIGVAVAGPARAGAGIGIAAIAALAVSLLARRAIGGSTGDTIGATGALAAALGCAALGATWT